MRKWIGFVAVAALVAAGCGEPKVNLPEPAPASGRVTLASGQPVKDVRIVFEPVDAMAAASALVSSGSFSLQTYDSKPGACPGKYRVIFRVNQSGTSQAELNRSAEALRSIPVKYQQDNSPLEVEVPSGGKTDFDLKLEAR